MREIIRKTAVPAALVLAVGVGATAADTLRDPVPAVDAQSVQALPPAREAGDLASAFRAAATGALPSVVHVGVEMEPRGVSAQLPEELRGTPFEEFFRAPQPSRPATGSGSGFVIRPDGYILTNNHVVADARRVTVTFTDKREFEAEVVGRDPNTDIAVVKIDAENLPTVRLGDSDALQVGDWVLALGYPMSLGETVTAGIVSAKGRSLGIVGRDENASAPLEHFIQTDAAINPGNSGGPLVNLRGEVIGINSAIASQTGFYAGYGFAVPARLAKRVADDLIEHGVVRRPRLGVQIDDVRPADVEVFRLRDARGAVVKAVQDGPAKDAGVRLGDVIVAVDGARVEDPGDLMERIALRQPGERVVLDLVRYGETERVSVRLNQFEAGEASVATPATGSRDDSAARLGFAATPVTPRIAGELRMPDAEGLVVTGVDPVGPAAAAGLTRGFVIDRVNGERVRTPDELRGLVGGLEPGATVSIVGRATDGTETIVNYRAR